MRSTQSVAILILLLGMAGCHSARPTAQHRVVATECFNAYEQAEARLDLARQQLNIDGLTDSLRAELAYIIGADAADAGELLVTCCRRLIDSQVCGSDRHPFDIVFTASQPLSTTQADTVRGLLQRHFPAH